MTRFFRGACAAALLSAIPFAADATAKLDITWQLDATPKVPTGQVVNQPAVVAGRQVITTLGSSVVVSSPAPSFGPVQTGYARIHVISGAAIVIPTIQGTPTEALGIRITQCDGPIDVPVNTGETISVLEAADAPQCASGSTGLTVLPGSVTPTVPTTVLTTGGVAQSFTASHGGYICNPLSATDQGVTSEVIYVNPVTTATAAGNGGTSNLAAGQCFNLPPGMTTNLSWVATTTSHKINAVVW